MTGRLFIVKHFFGADFVHVTHNPVGGAALGRRQRVPRLVHRATKPEERGQEREQPWGATIEEHARMVVTDTLVERSSAL